MVLGFGFFHTLLKKEMFLCFPPHFFLAPCHWSLTHNTILDRSLGTEIVVSAQAPSPSCNYIFLKRILCKGEDQREAMLKDKAVETDTVSALEARLFLKDMSVNRLVLKSILSSS